MFKPPKLMLLMWLILGGGCAPAASNICDLPCELGIDQTAPLTVIRFVDYLIADNWLQARPSGFQATYAPDTFSNVLETTTLITLDGSWPHFYGTEINLYIGSVGGINPNHQMIAMEEIEAIQVTTKLPIVLSWLLYGLPEGGQVLPYYLTEDLAATNPCPNRSHYVAYYHDSRTIIRGVVQRPIWLNLWFTPVEIVYPIAERLEYTTYWKGRFERMDHIPCMP